MFYNVMFHAINNIIPVLVLYGMQFLMQLMARALGMNGSGMWNFVMDTATSQVSQLSPAFMGNLYDRWRRGAGNFVSGQSRVTSWAGRLSKRIISKRKTQTTVHLAGTCPGPGCNRRNDDCSRYDTMVCIFNKDKAAF